MDSDVLKQRKIMCAVNPILNSTEPNYPQGVLAQLITPVDDLELLESLGYVTQALTAERPTLKAVLYSLLFGKLNDNLFEMLISSFENLKERFYSPDEAMMVHVFTEKKFGGFLQLATKVDNHTANASEVTYSFDCLFTTDKQFNVNKVGTYDNPQKLKVLSSMTSETPSCFSKQHCYLLSILTKETCGKKEEFVRDYLLYLPSKCFVRYV